MTKHKWITPEIRSKAEQLLAKMTLEEKAGQMTQYDWGFNPINPDTGRSQHEAIMEQIAEGKVGSIFNLSGAEEANQMQRLILDKTANKIPLLIGRDVIHGYRTVFPIPLAQASAWNPELAGQTAAAASREALADGVAWVFAPMIDVTRDPRWGRIAESIGEDPYLASAYAKAWVEGSQVEEGPGLAAASCPKHYAGYGWAEAGRDYNTVDVSDRVLREVILPPFREAVDSGALSIMASFNEVNGIPACANRYLLTTILREEWGFEGIAVSDYNALQELIVHGVAANEEEACEMSIKAGLDMDMASGIYIRYLPKLVREGKVPEQLVDEAVLRILAVKLKLGLFEQPYVPSSAREYATDSNLPSDHVALARQSAKESIVLLRNENRILPLNKEISSLAVIGPLAGSKKDPLGCWAMDGRADEVVSLLEGIQQAVSPGVKIHYAAGCSVESDSEDAGLGQALDAIRQADVVIMGLGESFEMSGEARCRTNLDLPGGQRRLVEAAAALGKPIVAILLSGRPLAIPWLQDNVAAIVQAWHLGVQSGHAIADVLFGDYNPSGRLTATFPRSAGQIPIYYYRKNTGRPPGGIYTSYYLDSTTEPLYPFGYGLSYTTIEYGAIKCVKDQIRIGQEDAFELTLDITNTGSRTGEEVVQCYIRDEAASVTQPLKKLVAFRKLRLEAGEKTVIQFRIPTSSLAILDSDMNLTVEPGHFTIYIGPNSSEGESIRVTVTE